MSNADIYEAKITLSFAITFALISQRPMLSQIKVTQRVSNITKFNISKPQNVITCTCVHSLSIAKCSLSWLDPLVFLARGETREGLAHFISNLAYNWPRSHVGKRVPTAT